MGLDLAYQAIPPGSDLLEIARCNLEDGGALSLIPFWFSRDDGGPRPGREGEEPYRLWDACCRLAGNRPDLHACNCFLDRRWDALHYLLSASRRGEPETDADAVMDFAFRTGDPIADHVSGGQGIPVRHLPPATVSAIGAIVEPLNIQELARHFEPVRMESAAVYKFSADHADAAEWRRIEFYFERFRRFFTDAAGKGDAVIAVLD